VVWFLASCRRISHKENKDRKFRSEPVNGKGHLEDLDIDGRIILKWFLSKKV
jgi:hypothetical protein